MAATTAGETVTDKVKWGVLGTGRITRRLLEAIAESNCAEAVIIGGRDPQKARALAEEFEVPRAGVLEDVWHDEEVQAIYNATPNSWHAPLTIKALQAKKHVLCEKPLSLKFEDVEAMFRVARENGVLLMEAFMYRYNPQWPRVAEIIRSGKIGRVRHIHAAFGFRSDNFSDVRFSSQLQGGAIADIGCYCINISRLAAAMNNPMARPVAVSAMAQWHEDNPQNVDEVLVGNLRFSDGVVAQICCALRINLGAYCVIYGEDGKIEIPNPIFGGPAGELHVICGDQREMLEFPGANNYVLEVENFSRAVQGREELLLSPEDALENARVISACLQAARERREVSWS